MTAIQEFLFQGGDTRGLPIDKNWCLNLLSSYLDTRKRYKWILKDDTMFITDINLNHILTLRWYKYGFRLEDDFDNISAEGLEVILISINIVFRSLCETLSDCYGDIEEEMEGIDKKEGSDKDYWV